MIEIPDPRRAVKAADIAEGLAARGVRDGMAKLGRGLEKDLERAYAPFGRLARAWASRTFPGPGKGSLEAATIVFGRGGRRINQILEIHGTGATIRSSEGFFLAVPTENAPKRGVGRGRISPSNFPEHRFGPLRFVFRRPPRPSLLVVDDVRASFSRKTGALRGFRRASDTARRTGRGLTTVVMFLLFPKITLRQRVDLRGIAARWERRAAEIVAAEIERSLRGPRR